MAVNGVKEEGDLHEGATSQGHKIRLFLEVEPTHQPTEKSDLTQE